MDPTVLSVWSPNMYHFVVSIPAVDHKWLQWFLIPGCDLGSVTVADHRLCLQPLKGSQEQNNMPGLTLPTGFVFTRAGHATAMELCRCDNINPRTNKTIGYELLDFRRTVHYSDVIMGPTASQITSLTIVFSTVYSDADQRKHQSSASLAFVRGNSPHKWPVTRKMFPFDDVIMCAGLLRHVCYVMWPQRHCSQWWFLEAWRLFGTRASVWHVSVYAVLVCFWRTISCSYGATTKGTAESPTSLAPNDSLRNISEIKITNKECRYSNIFDTKYSESCQNC